MCMEVDLPALRSNGSPGIWCERTGSTQQEKLRLLTLDFRGRCSKASSKNFQLETPGIRRGKKEDTELLFGKTDVDTFVLDYRYPLGMAQAFAIALSTKDWQ